MGLEATWILSSAQSSDEASDSRKPTMELPDAGECRRDPAAFRLCFPTQFHRHDAESAPGHASIYKADSGQRGAEPSIIRSLSA